VVNRSFARAESHGVRGNSQRSHIFLAAKTCWVTLRAMRFPTRCVGPVIGALFLTSCASRPLPKYEKPIARTEIQSVRTTAYTHSESDHLQHGRRTALGTTLRSGPVHSAAADWSRWPAGTVFRILETGEVYEVDDYGWALAGTNTIDLYKPSRRAMNAWGVRRVTIQNLRWGNPERSLAVLRPRSKHRHIKRMLDGFRRDQRPYPQLAGDQPNAPAAPTTMMASAPAPVVAQSARPVATSGTAPIKPFFTERAR